MAQKMEWWWSSSEAQKVLSDSESNIWPKITVGPVAEIKDFFTNGLILCPNMPQASVKQEKHFSKPSTFTQNCPGRRQSRTSFEPLSQMNFFSNFGGRR